MTQFGKELHWKPVALKAVAVKARNLSPMSWENVLPDALHLIWNLIPHLPTVRNMKGCLMWNNLNVYINRTSLPTWHSHPGPVFLKRDVWLTKYDPLVDKVELIEANPFYAHIWHKDSSQSTVSFWDLAPITDPNNSTLT